MDEFPLIATIDSPGDAARHRLRRPTAIVLSFAAHLALVGGLWSAQVGRRFEFLLAGKHGSIDLQASIAQPPPTDVMTIERPSPMQVRVEPDHAHVDRQTVWVVPPVKPPTTVPISDEPDEHGADHAHPHEHGPPTARPDVSPLSSTEPSTAADASTAASSGHDERLPTPFYNPPPEYPAEAQQARLEGTTVLRVGVRSDGVVEFVSLAQSSGHALLDEAAVAAVRRWRFTPGRVREVAAPFVLRLPIAFRLR